MKTINTKRWWDTPDNFTGIAIDENGHKKWYLNGECHREDGPAIEWFNGNKSWFLNDKCYTEDEYKKEMAKRSSSLGKLILNGDHFKL